MRSVGPSIAFVTKKDRKTMEKLLKPRGLSVAISTKADDKKLTITKDMQ
jgi:hypothetical protein